MAIESNKRARTLLRYFALTTYHGRCFGNFNKTALSLIYLVSCLAILTTYRIQLTIIYRRNKRGDIYC